VGAVCFGVACRDCSLIETCGVIAEAEGQEIAERFPSSQANRRALRLQAQGGFPAGRGARKSSASRRFDLCRLERRRKKTVHRTVFWNTGRDGGNVSTCKNKFLILLSDQPRIGYRSALHL